MQYTNQYQFNLIESGDTFSAAPLNENAEKMEEALETLNQSIEAAKSAGLQVATGSYTGTGTYGSSNKNTLTFSFRPMVVIVMCKASGAYGGVWLQGATNGTTSSSSQATLTWSDNGVSWYHFNNYAYQLNDTNVTYLYAAIGLI